MRKLKISDTATRETTSLSDYINEIEKFDYLSLEEEVELSKKIKSGDKKALEKLVKANLRLVVQLANQYKSQDPNLVLEELINEGNLGLITGAQTYDPKKDKEFKLYAFVTISNYINQAINEMSSIVRLPINETIGSRGKIGKPYTKFEETSNDSPLSSEIKE